MWFATAFELLADALDGLERFGFFGLAPVFRRCGEMPFDHRRTVGKLLSRSRGPNCIGFLKAHHFDEKLMAVGCKAKIQRGFASPAVRCRAAFFSDPSNSAFHAQGVGPIEARIQATSAGTTISSS